MLLSKGQDYLYKKGVSRMQNNDHREAIEIYSQMIYRLAFSGTGNVHDAEDITQNVFYKLLKYRKQFNSEEHRKAWLLRVTVNEIKLFKRSGWFRKRDSNELAEITDDTDPAILAENRMVHDAVMALKQEQRMVVMLHYYYGYSTSEISAMTGIKEETVRTRIKRARTKLKNILKEEFDDE